MAEQRFETDISFTCPNCKDTVSTCAEVPEPDWPSTERTADITSDGPTEIICPNCEHIFQAYVYNSAGTCEVELLEFPDTIVTSGLAQFSDIR